MMRNRVRMRVFSVFVNGLGRPDDSWVGRADDIRVLAGVGDGMQDVLYGVETRPIFVIGAYNRPWRIRSVCVEKHRFLGLGVGLPPAQGLDIHRAEFPLLQGILRPSEKPP